MRLKYVALCFAVVAIAVMASGTIGAQSVATTVQAFNITSGLPTAGPTVPPSSGANTCAVVLNAPPVNTTLTPQGSDNGLSWVPLPGIGGGSITKAGVYVGPNPHLYFRVYFASTSFPGVTGYEACGANALAVLTPLLAGSGGVGPSGPPGPSGSPGPVGSPGVVAAVNPITLNSGVVGCSGQVLACATVLQASAYGVVGDNSTDNTAGLGNAITAACAVAGSGVGGVTLQLPIGIVITGPQQLPCSNVTILGYGKGYGGGTPHYPTPVQPGTTLKCKAATSTPLLLMMPTTAVAQASNSVRDLGFDGNSDACQIGLQVTGQEQPTFYNLSFVGFSNIGLYWLGGQIGGTNKGSVIHPYAENLQFSMLNPGDGTGMVWDGSASNGDVFSALVNNMSCVYYANPCAIIARTDHNQINDIQASSAAGATALYTVVLKCNAISFYASNLLLDNPMELYGNVDCILPDRVPVASMYNYQDYGNDAPAPVVHAGASLTLFDDRGNQFMGNQTGYAGSAPFICFGLPFLDSVSENGCTYGQGILWATQQGDNLSMGTRGTHGTQSGHVLFCTSGCGTGHLPANYDSFVDEHGCLAFGSAGSVPTPGPTPTSPGTPTPAPSASPSTETAHYCNSNALVNGGYVPPIFTASGGVTASTYHGAQFACTFAAATSCLLGAAYWTGSAGFSSASSIDGCSFSTATNDGITFIFRQTFANTGTVYASASNSDTVTGICWGT